MSNPESGSVYEGQEPNVETLQSLIAQAEASNQKYKELIETV